MIRTAVPSRLFQSAFFALCLTRLYGADQENSTARSALPEELQITSDYNIKDGFDAAGLRALAGKATLEHNDKRRLMLLILHAAIRKDDRFADLLKKSDLRKAENVDLALCAYDFTLNRSSAALDHILAQLATEDIGADADAIIVLSILDEWNRSIRAFRKHFVVTDGTGAGCKGTFMATRARLYPAKYKDMKEAIEAPILPEKPLLPQGR